MVVNETEIEAKSGIDEIENIEITTDAKERTHLIEPNKECNFAITSSPPRSTKISSICTKQNNKNSMRK